MRPEDLERDTFRSGGPGGQHQNKTESGIRYTHLPTGIAAESRTERSQHKNDANALALLKAKLYRIEAKDVRTGVETTQVQAVLDGEIDDFIQAYLRQKAEKTHKKVTA